MKADGRPMDALLMVLCPFLQYLSYVRSVSDGLVPVHAV